MKRSFRVLALAVTAAFAGGALAQAFPNKPVRIVIGFGAGGVTDILNRALGDEMGKVLGQAVVVENRTGAGGLVAAQAVRAAPPDGYMIAGGGIGSLAPVLVKENPINGPKDMAAISNVALGDWFMYAPTSAPFRTLGELAAYGKANPGKVRFAAPAVINQMLFATVAKRMGFEFENIPYKATDQTIVAMLGGDAQVTFNAASSFPPHIQAGKLRALGTLSPRRTEVMPDVPTLVEQGVPLTLQFGQALWAPLGVPRDIVNRLNSAVAEALKQPVMRERLRGASLTAAHTSPEDLVKLWESEVKFYQDAADLIGFKPQ